MDYKNKDMNDYLGRFNDCLQHEVAFCSAECPFNLDVNTFISRLQEGRFDAAYKVFRDATGFPFIAEAICNGPCKGSCPLAVGKGEAIDLPRLEKACLTYVKKKEPVFYNLPGKKKSIAVIGGGISGISCALRLATKRYSVTVYEKSEHIGGHIIETVDKDLIAEDFALQMQHLDYTIEYNREIISLDDIVSDYDAIYVATGADGISFGINTDVDFKALTGEVDDPAAPCALIDDTGVFLGGSLLGRDSVNAMADGLRIATAIDNFLMTKNLKYPIKKETLIQIDESLISEGSAVSPAEGVYTKEEAVEEAKRCLKCQCNACRLHCDLTEYTHKWPLRLRDEILATTAPGKSELHATPAVRLINTCTHCGLCKDTCPEDIDMDGLIQAARVRMHRLEKMPWAFNDFFLRDMAFSNGEKSYICRKSPISNECSYAFFPGCQLSSSAPELVTDAYDYLLSREPDTGIMLGCCGVPALWAGDEELHLKELERIRRDWESLDKPILILACPTCRNRFKEDLPEIETVLLYEIMDKWGVSQLPGVTVAKASDGAFSVFDPCATDCNDPVRASVRSLCKAIGAKLEPLPVQEKWSACCSFGGHGAIADPVFASHVKKKRIEEGKNPYITYCINCRDAFISEGKESYHILNLLFDREPHADTVSQRRINRTLLKNNLLEKFGDNPIPLEELGMKLEISPELKKKISDDYILESEVADVISFCERTGRTLYDTEKDTYTGYKKIENMTFWAEYKKPVDSDVYVLVNAYSHRMEIELEMVWNGKKIDIDM